MPGQRQTSVSGDPSPNDDGDDTHGIRADQRTRVDSAGATERHDVDHDDDHGAVTSDRRVDEQRIRADERTRIEDELRELERDRPTGEPVAGHEQIDRPVEHDDSDLRDRRIGDEDQVTQIDPGDRTTIRVDEPIQVIRTRSFSTGQLLTLLAGAALVALGVYALVSTGVDTPLNQPVESVLGWNHTPMLGIVEIGSGALLVLLSLRPGGRWLVGLIGVALIGGGILILGELDWTIDELGAEQGYAWVPIIAGAVAVLGSLLTPRRHQRMTGVPVVD